MAEVRKNESVRLYGREGARACKSACKSVRAVQWCDRIEFARLRVCVVCVHARIRLFYSDTVGMCEREQRSKTAMCSEDMQHQ